MWRILFDFILRKRSSSHELDCVVEIKVSLIRIIIATVLFNLYCDDTLRLNYNDDDVAADTERKGRLWTSGRLRWLRLCFAFSCNRVLSRLTFWCEVPVFYIFVPKFVFAKPSHVAVVHTRQFTFVTSHTSNFYIYIL